MTPSAESERKCHGQARTVATALDVAGDPLDAPDLAGAARFRLHRLVELDIEGEHVEIVLGPEPSAVARLSTDADARAFVSRDTMSQVLLGGPLDPDAKEWLLQAKHIG